MLYSRARDNGQTLLEMALVLPVFIVFTLGAVDITHSVRSYGTLKESVRKALRCVYPTDGACVSSAATAPGILYDVYQETGDESFVEDMFRVTGIAKGINAPNINFTNFSARVLGSVSSTVSTYSHNMEQRMFPASGSLSGPMQITAGPYISGTGPNNVNFRYAATPGSSYPPSSSRGIGNLSGAVINSPGQRQQNLGTVSFTVPQLPTRNGSGCVRASSASFDGSSGHQPELSTLCEGVANVNLVAHFSGNSQNSSNGAQGTVLLDYRVQGKFGWRSLGGRQYSSSPGMRDASLVPRGSRLSYVSPALRSSYPEFALHSNIEVGAGETVDFRLRLVIDADDQQVTQPGDTVTFNGENLRIYLPLYSDFEQQFDCDGMFLPSDANDPEALENCVPGAQMSTLNVLTEQPYQVTSTVMAGYSSAQGNFDSDAAITALGFLPEDWFMAGTQLQTHNVSLSQCPENNGTSATVGQGSVILDNSSAAAICPPQYLTGTAIPVSAQNIDSFTHTVTNKSLGFGPYSYVKQNCSYTESLEEHVDPSFFNYPDRSFSEVYAGFTQVYTGSDTDPDELIETASYSCDLGQNSFNVFSTATFPSQAQLEQLDESSFFKTLHPRACEDALNDAVQRQKVSFKNDSVGKAEGFRK